LPNILVTDRSVIDLVYHTPWVLSSSLLESEKGVEFIFSSSSLKILPEEKADKK
jgi:hypothetical protein